MTPTEALDAAIETTERLLAHKTKHLTELMHGLARDLTDKALALERQSRGSWVGISGVGEIQSAGPILDCYCAQVATLREQVRDLKSFRDGIVVRA